jgi:soluble lytic murein transglycosylase-like protein
MTVFTIGPALALVAFLVAIVTSLSTPLRPDWRIPAVLGAVLAAFSVWAIADDGLFGLWREHTDSLWGNQVWFDLLLAFGMAWTALLPRARAAGMALGFWAVALIATGSIGLLAMLARLLWHEGQAR